VQIVQARHFSTSILAFGFSFSLSSSIAATGHMLTQIPQPMHFVASAKANWVTIFAIKLSFLYPLLIHIGIMAETISFQIGQNRYL
jgi:hypothetical protein